MVKLCDHLETNEEEDERHRVPQVEERRDRFGEQQVERAQRHECEEVGGVDNERVLRDAYDGWDRVDSEDDVGDLYADEDDEQRCRLPNAAHAREELLAIVRVGRVHASPREPHHGIVLEIGLLLWPEHLDSREDENQRKSEQHRPELSDNGDAGGNHHATQQQRREDTPLENPLGVLFRHPEIVEEHQKDEEVVDGETLLHQEAGEEIHAPARALERQYDAAAEGDGGDKGP
mmetsp:Transcript_18077/g.41420  ORF Transcript_18077/g.41420 Transcript_18077/m.41420 type:complete len:233 (+) Transcript_18077:226-924(+)